jgi:phage head maturation protease
LPYTDSELLFHTGAIDGLSIGYWIVKSHKSNNGVRYLTEIDLREISLVTFPMLPEARISNYEHQYSSLRPCSTESESQSKGTILQEKISKSPEEQLEESIQLLEQNFYKLIKIMK